MTGGIPTIAAVALSIVACGTREAPEHAQPAPRAATAEPVEPAERTGPAQPAERTEPVEPAADGAGGPRVSVGDCDVGWLPPSLVADVSEAETADLVETMKRWVGEGSVREVRIDVRRGIAFAKSEDDLGADPPYPSRTRAQSQLVCGLSTQWLLAHVHGAFEREASPDYGGVTCQKNVCCFPGMEFVSHGYLIVRRETLGERPQWIVDAYLEVAEAALGQEYAARNRAGVARALEALGRQRACPGEPPLYQ